MKLSLSYNCLLAQLKIKRGIALTQKQKATINLIASFLLIYSSVTPVFIRAFLTTLFFLQFFQLIINCIAQAQEPINYNLYTNIIYRFKNYINWHDEKRSGGFVIRLFSVSTLPLSQRI